MNAIEVNRRLVSILVCGAWCLGVCWSARPAVAADLPGGPAPEATAVSEATLFQLLRVHGDDAGKGSTDAARTNSTMGLHVGYFVIPALSLGAELRYQRWLSTPTQLVMGAKVDIPDVNKDTTTVAIGPRAHFAIGKGMWLRPGISYSRALDQPLSPSSYNMVQVDLPVIF